MPGAAGGAFSASGFGGGQSYKFGVNPNQGNLFHSNPAAHFPPGLGIEDKKAGDKYSVINKSKKSCGTLMDKKTAVGKMALETVKENTLKGITKPAIRRLARRGGVKRISNQIYSEVRTELRIFLETTLRDAVTYCEH